MDVAQEEARAELIQSDTRRVAAPPPVGVAAVNAAAAEAQHLANEVSAAARQEYLGHGAVATPWPCFVVCETRMQVVAGAAMPLTNYYFKVRVSAGAPAEHVQISTCEDPFGGPPKLLALRKGAQAEEPLAQFEGAGGGAPERESGQSARREGDVDRGDARPTKHDDDVLCRLALAAEVPDDAWRTRLQWTAAFAGVAGLDDRFVHLSTAAQVAGTAKAYFGGRADLMLLRFSADSMRREADLEVRWEAAAPALGDDVRDGAFPHVYGGAIPYACLASPPTLLALGPDGHVFPPQGAMEAAAAHAAATIDREEVEDALASSDEDMGYGICR